MKVYEAVYSDELLQGVYGISLVENPAMEDEWIALSEQPKEVHFAAVDDKKKLLLGAVLIPNKKIYRNIDGNEFYMTFSEDTIGKLAHDFIKDGFQNSSSAEHEVKLSDVARSGVVRGAALSALSSQRGGAPSSFVFFVLRAGEQAAIPDTSRHPVPVLGREWL